MNLTTLVYNIDKQTQELELVYIAGHATYKTVQTKLNYYITSRKDLVVLELARYFKTKQEAQTFAVFLINNHDTLQTLKEAFIRSLYTYNEIQHQRIFNRLCELHKKQIVTEYEQAVFERKADELRKVFEIRT